MQTEKAIDHVIPLDVTKLHHPRAERSHIGVPTVLWTPEIGYSLGKLYEEFDASGTRVYARVYSTESGHTPSIELIEQALSDLQDGKPLPEGLRLPA